MSLDGNGADRAADDWVCNKCAHSWSAHRIGCKICDCPTVTGVFRFGFTRRKRGIEYGTANVKSVVDGEPQIGKVTPADPNDGGAVDRRIVSAMTYVTTADYAMTQTSGPAYSVGLGSSYVWRDPTYALKEELARTKEELRRIKDGVELRPALIGKPAPRKFRLEEDGNERGGENVDGKI